MTAEILDQLNATATRAMLDADAKARERDAARERLATTALDIADRVASGAARNGRDEWLSLRAIEHALKTYTVALGNYRDAFDAALCAEKRRDDAFDAYLKARDEWNARDRSIDEFSAWLRIRNERALQEAQTEKEAHNA